TRRVRAGRTTPGARRHRRRRLHHRPHRARRHRRRVPRAQGTVGTSQAARPAVTPNATRGGSAIGFYGEQVLPRLTNVALGTKECTRLRKRITVGLVGDVLEVGFGSGLNVPHYPPTVRRVQAVDPATLGRTLAAERVAQSSIPVEYVGLDGAHLPLDDE